ncbi:hypothetical protein V8G54_035195 [Vigna mungo]|uniref:Uncharacterized protein n=1 Tax=Vigna mungo TaxID=3915 RepID=A0AAQ3RCU9_VIGMU
MVIWLLRVVNCDVAFVGRNEVAKQCTSAAVVLCNSQTRAVFYWPDIYSQPLAPVTSIASSSELGAVFTSDGKASFNRQRRQTFPIVSLHALPLRVAQVVSSGSFNALLLALTEGKCLKILCISNLNGVNQFKL